WVANQVEDSQMPDATIHAVTGAYGYSGKYIAQRLLDKGQTVITLTNSLSRQNPFGDRIKAFPFHFDQPDLLAEQLRGVSVLYNTCCTACRAYGPQRLDQIARRRFR